MNYGFIKVATAIPAVKVADCPYNVSQMLPLIEQADNAAAEIIAFPELGITAYSCADLFKQRHLIKEAEKALQTLVEKSADTETVIIAGLPVAYESTLLNCAVILHRGLICGLIPKSYLPEYNEFYEKRWFTPADELPADASVTICGQQVNIGGKRLFRSAGCTFGVEICEDLWAPTPPSTLLALRGAEVIINLSASNESAGKHGYLKQICEIQSAKCNAAYIYSGCGFGESSGDTVFGGNAFIIENGRTIASSKRFCTTPQLIISEIDVEKLQHERMNNGTFATARAKVAGENIHRCAIPQKNRKITLTRPFSPTPFIPSNDKFNERCEEIFSIQSAGLAKRIEHTCAKSCVIGISGGLDSTLALLATVRAFDLLGRDHKDITAVTMPGFGTTDRTYNNAISLMKNLGVTIREISIKAACLQHFADIGHNPDNHDVTYENSQARERTQILMDIANQTAGFVVGTGDLSELALGWATYNGDHMSMYGVNASVPKTLVRHLVQWAADNCVNDAARTTLLDIIDTPISPELIPADDRGNITQKTEDLVGPYELHDFFLYHMLRNGSSPRKIYMLAQRAFAGAYDNATIKKWLTTFTRRFFNQQFKRSCMPDGPKVGSCSLSPRGDWRMPSDASSATWLKECDTLE